MGEFTFKHIFSESLVESSGACRTVLVLLLIPCCFAMDFRAPPIIPNIPFLWAWNAPTENCLGMYNEPIDLSIFSLVGSPRKSATGQSVTIFYTDRLGHYPHIDSKHRSVHGGIPQLGNLQRHLEQAKADIVHYMPIDIVGLAVIDWEDWRPTWERNWKPKDIYRNKSIELVQQQNVQLNLKEATKIAKEEFERAGRSFMEETIKLGISIRPNHYWGYYLFPDCYNHKINDPDYDGICSKLEKDRNDGINWLWNASTALYPSIYLKTELKSNPNGALYVRGRVQEAIRVSKLRDAKNPLPIFVYHRLVFSNVVLEFLAVDDLVNTIGETVALGASGMVIWGTLSLQRSMKSCLILHDYMERTLNPYLINVTLASKMCSQVLCEDQGMCTRKDWNSFKYLHLNPTSFNIKILKKGKYEIRGKPTLEDLEYFSSQFRCSCYANLNCKERDNMHTVRTVNVCAYENVCIDAFLNFESSDEPANLQESLADTTHETDTAYETDKAHEMSTSQKTVQPPITASATVPSSVPGKYISGCLVVLFIYSGHLKYFL